MRFRYMLDTDIASYVIRDDDQQLKHRFLQHLDELCISDIVLAELRFGVEKKNTVTLKEKVRIFCEVVPSRPFGALAAQVYGNIRALLEKSGFPVGPMDLLIASSAMAENAILVTNNTAHFSRIPGLCIENWKENT